MEQEVKHAKEEKEPSVLTLTLAEIFEFAGMNYQPYPVETKGATQSASTTCN